MKFDISQILSGKKRSMEFDIELSSEEQSELEKYLPESANAVSKADGNAKIEDKGEYISVKVYPEMDVVIPCSRCLTPVKLHVCAPFERIIPTVSGGGDGIFDDDDIISVVEGCVNVMDDLCEELALAVPDRALCREDCPGLCPKCGKSLADGECGCKKEREIDPRMRIFEKLLNDDE